MAERGEAGTGRMAEPIEIADAAMTLLSPSRSNTAIRQANPDHRRADARADRPGALHRQPLVRQAGLRHRARRGGGRRGRDAGQRAGELARSAGRRTSCASRARARCSHAVENALPADVAIFAAAVADWRVAHEGAQKIKKGATAIPPLQLTRTPTFSPASPHRIKNRPKLVIGFAAETENVIANAQSKLARKGCDWILANDVSAETGVMGGDRNTIHLVTAKGVEDWPEQSKDDVAQMLIDASPPESENRELSGGFAFRIRAPIADKADA